jgi:hypothetical protein
LWRTSFDSLTLNKAETEQKPILKIGSSDICVAKRGQAPLPERPFGCFAQRCLIPFRAASFVLHAVDYLPEGVRNAAIQMGAPFDFCGHPGNGGSGFA